MEFRVYVNMLKSTGDGILVEAANGTEHGPPFVRWKMSSSDLSRAGEQPYIGKHYVVTIKDPMS